MHAAPIFFQQTFPRLLPLASSAAPKEWGWGGHNDVNRLPSSLLYLPSFFSEPLTMPAAGEVGETFGRGRRSRRRDRAEASGSYEKSLEGRGRSSVSLEFLDVGVVVGESGVHLLGSGQFLLFGFDLRAEGGLPALDEGEFLIDVLPPFDDGVSLAAEDLLKVRDLVGILGDVLGDVQQRLHVLVGLYLKVNISTAWFLPEEGFPVFYRYFDDKVTWNGARAACGSHHADLLSVHTSARMDAARAYLKEIDVADNVWIGLQKESPGEPFSWTNGEKLLGDGYWVEQVPKSSEKLCVAIDPAADFRWNTHYCGGPEVASFVCELRVPEWAKKENGCLMSSLPSLTVTLIPEAGVIQLLSDCGLDGTRRIACNEKANREEIIKHLSCDVDAFGSTLLTGSTGGATRQIDTQPISSSDINNHINLYDTTRSYRPLTRHRRSASFTSPTPPDTPPQKQTTTTPNKHLSHAFPHSPYLASERNAPSTKPPTPATALSSTQNTTPHPTRPTPSPSTSNGTALIYKPLPVLLIADGSPELVNDTLPPAVSDNPPIVLMIDDKNLDGPFLFPLADDIIINNPSLSPLQIVNVDLVEMDNFTANGTNNLTTPIAPPEAPVPAPIRPLHSHAPLLPTTSKHGNGETGEEPRNAVEAEAKTDIPQRPNRGRLFTHLTHYSYPRLLNRLLG